MTVRRYGVKRRKKESRGTSSVMRCDTLEPLRFLRFTWGRGWLVLGDLGSPGWP